MTPLEILAAKVRGADSNAAGAAIVEKWYGEQIKHAVKTALESAEIIRGDASKIGGATQGMLNQVASNFETVIELLSIGGQIERNNDNGPSKS